MKSNICKKLNIINIKAAKIGDLTPEIYLMKKKSNMDAMLKAVGFSRSCLFVKLFQFEATGNQHPKACKYWEIDVRWGVHGS